MATTTRTVDLARDDVDHIVHPVTAYVDHERNGPLVIVEGKGIWVTDADGKQYLDSLACLWNVNVGHGRAEIGAAMAEQVKEIAFAPSFWGISNVPAIKLAKRLAEIFPDGIARFFFTSGGSESNETAFKMARYYHRARGKTDKHKIIARHGGYHGVSYGALSATGIQAYHDNFGPLVPGFVHIPPPNLYQYPEWREGQPLPAACTGQALEQKILEEGPDTVAAFVAEPVQGVGGVIAPPDEYW
ncbi:MAG: aspartate aminotransferase family protein, partial [Chloroflexi bacterium]|nr:aspartate aminotransferase family protein [Chloroflexota bacterium]